MIQYVTYICIIILIVGLWWYQYRNKIEKLKALPNDKMIRIQGIISSQPYQKNTKQIIQISEFSIITERFPKYFYGDNLVVVGKLDNQVIDFEKPRLYLIDPSIERIDLSKVSRKKGNFNIKSILYEIRRKVTQKFNLLLTEPQSSLLSGILLGVKRELPSKFADALRNTGTLHVIVASGFNVTVVAGVIAYAVTKFFARRWSIPLIVVGISLYTLMAGAEPPVVRAAIMAGMSFVAQLLGKHYQGLWALILASVVMLLLSPFLLFDVGFQLSVAATGGILLLSPLIARIFRNAAKFFGFIVVEELAVTLGAQLAVLPILLVNFQQASWLSPLTNLIVVFVIPILMGMGAVLAMIAFISRAMAQLFALFVWVPLTFFVGVVEWFDGLPFGVFTVAKISWWWVVGYYLVFAWWIWRSYRTGGKGIAKVEIKKVR